MFLTLNRTVLIYCIIIFAMRIMGKRQLGELQPSELVSTILISNLASIPIESPELPFVNCIAPILLIVSLEILLSVLGTKSKKIETLISGHAKTVITDGVINQDILKELRFTVDDLLSALRMQGVFDPEDVSLALVETNGSLSVYKTQDATEVTIGFFDSEKEKDECMKSPLLPIIVDGVIDKEVLKDCDIKESWVNKALKISNTNKKEVYLMLCNKEKKYQIVKKNAN